MTTIPIQGVKFMIVGDGLTDEHARLVAAAPMLLSACRSAVDALTQNKTFQADIDLAVLNLSEAITKATAP